MTIAAKFLEVQNELNLKLSPEWATKDWNYCDAMFTEATEAYNHLNWEWWRATDRKVDWDQVKLELVDVGHFLFSEIIAKGYQNSFNKVIEECQTKLPTPPVEHDVKRIKRHIKCLIQSVLRYDDIEDFETFAEETRKDSFETVQVYFFSVMHELGLTLEQFYTLFIGKVCLNQLRWKNGYKKGIYQVDGHSPREYYVKTWYEAGKDPVEDNVWLAEYAATLDPNDVEFKSKLETALDAKYKEVYELVWGK